MSLRKLIDEAAGIGALKSSGVKLCSTKSSPYCRMERLVERTGQMGVPVTEVLFEEQESEFILGFDRAKLGKLLET